MIQFNPISLAEFLNNYWQQKPILLRNALPDYHSPITPDELAGLSLEDDVESRMVIQKGPEDYELKRGPFEESIYAELPDKDWTLLIQGCDRLLPEIADLLNDFDFLPRWRVDDIMISYATEGGNVGPHFDHYDVFLLQASGQRHWHLTSQDCLEENYIQGVDLRLMKTFTVEQDFVLNPGDILYLPPKIGHHGIALDNDCMTFSIGYRSYRGQEIWDSFGDHLSEHQLFQELYYDPKMQPNLNAGEVTAEAAQQAKALMLDKLEDPAIMQIWFARFATQLDQGAASSLPDPLDPSERGSLETFIEALNYEHGLIKDPVCRFAYTETDQCLLFINGAQWSCDHVPKAFIQLLANQNYFDIEGLQAYLDNEAVQKLIYELWTLQYLTFIE
jgi:50S ribosomal protein L16 3-hydroxylase